MKTHILSLILITLSIQFGYSQKIDSTQIGKKYPYIFPILGKKAFEKGYNLPKPHGFMITSIFSLNSGGASARLKACRATKQPLAP